MQVVVIVGSTFKNKYGGLTEEELCTRGLPDYLREGLDIVFIGINPGLAAAYSGRYYSGAGNHFWQALHLSGLTPRPMSFEDDHKMLDHGIGFTDVVARTTRGQADLKRSEIEEGAAVLREKLARYRPKIAVFNGKGSVQQSRLSSQFVFQCCNLPLRKMHCFMFHLNLHFILNFKLLKMGIIGV